VKRRVKDAVSFIGAYEEGIVRYAGQFHVQGVLCGHIHTPAIRQIGEVTYYNCGDWVENCSVVVEHRDGRMELLTNLQLSPPENITRFPAQPNNHPRPTLTASHD
ncbi:MAG: UDP-2,3-diacylglucosamine diphosphatase, partial [Bryobacteraceae bacterium]